MWSGIIAPRIFYTVDLACFHLCGAGREGRGIASRDTRGNLFLTSHMCVLAPHLSPRGYVGGGLAGKEHPGKRGVRGYPV